MFHFFRNIGWAYFIKSFNSSRLTSLRWSIKSVFLLVSQFSQFLTHKFFFSKMHYSLCLIATYSECNFCNDCCSVMDFSPFEYFCLNIFWFEVSTPCSAAFSLINFKNSLSETFLSAQKIKRWRQLKINERTITHLLNYLR